MVIGLITLVYLWSLAILGIIAVTMTDKSKMAVVAYLLLTNVACYSGVFLKYVNARRTNEIPQQTK